MKRLSLTLLLLLALAIPVHAVDLDLMDAPAQVYFSPKGGVTCRVSSDHSILEGGPPVQVIPAHCREGTRGHLAQA